MSIVTFVIPSIARPSLVATLDSLMDQSRGAWEAIVVYDGVPPVNHGSTDSRIREVCLPNKLGGREQNGHGGFVRNEAFPLVKTPWIGFVDDDDRLLPNYVESLERDMVDKDLVVFRMQRGEAILPPPGTKVLVMGAVGISFAVRTDFIAKHGIKFISDDYEDFEFLRTCIDAGARVRISESLTYILGLRRG